MEFPTFAITKKSNAMAEKEKRIVIPAAAAGALPAVWKTLKRGSIDKKYYFRALLTLLFSAAGEPFRAYERRRYAQLLEEFEITAPPIFIVGHWRSGTTHLHNLMAKDPRMGYVTTYHSAYSEIVLNPWGKALFKGFTKLMLPEKRQGDNVRMHPDYPQEEEFAISNISSHGFYNFWYFPKQVHEFYDKYILFEGASAAHKKAWKEEYVRLVKTALINTDKQRFLSKNPPHTGRIDLLLELFPNAKFVHIYRNPISVFLSTRKFFLSMMPSLQFQEIGMAELEQNIFDIYKRLINRYFEQCQHIPKGNLTEVRFETLETNPMKEVYRIYNELHLSGWENARANIEKYAESRKHYVKNKHFIAPDLVKRIENEWGFAMKKWGYGLPDNLTMSSGIAD